MAPDTEPEEKNPIDLTKLNRDLQNLKKSVCDIDVKVPKTPKTPTLDTMSNFGQKKDLAKTLLDWYNVIQQGNDALNNTLQYHSEQSSKDAAKIKDLEEKLKKSQNKLVEAQSDLISQFKETVQKLESSVVLQSQMTESLKSLADAGGITHVNVEATPNTSAVVDKEIHSLIIEDTDNTAFTEQKWSDVLKGSVSEKLHEIPVTKSTLTAKGKGYVVFPDRESRDIAAKALKDDFIVIESDKKLKTLLPKMKIFDLDYFKKDEIEKLKSTIPKKNPKIKALVDGGATLDVIFIREPSDSDFYSYAVIRVDPRIREEIIKNQRLIFIGTSSHYVRDHTHVTQCFTCQDYGHKCGSSHCSLNDKGKHTCLYCAGDHKSSHCSVKRDANCMKTNKYRNAANHTSTSRECPIQEMEINRIIRRTNCDSKNYPIQRTHFQAVKIV